MTPRPDSSVVPTDLTRRGFLRTGLAAAAVTALPSLGGASVAAAAEGGYLVGRGIADTTGPIAENGMMGYSMPEQKSAGLHQRLRARAFVVVDTATGNRIAWCVADQAILPVAAHREIVTRVQARLGTTYDLHNICVTCTHTHSAPGGCSHDLIYNLAILGFQKQTFDAFVDGYVEAIVAAHRDLAPGTITLGRGELHDASVNRSKPAFDNNPQVDKDHFPEAIDPSVTVLRFRQGATDIGAITWYSTHGTSLPNTNLLVSGDNKGYAAYRWEREVLGQDYLDASPGFVAAHAQTNSGDMSPNLDLEPGTGPTDDPFENVRIIGARQHDAAYATWSQASTPVTGSVDSRAAYVDMSAVQVDGRFTPDGQPGRTWPGVLGASMLAGSVEDGPGIPIPEGTTDPFAQLWDKLPRDTPPWLTNAQSPKACAVPAGLIDACPDVLALQVVKLGQLYLVAGPAEYTIVAGLRIRQHVAQAVDAPLENVLVQGYSNGYSQYVTTPEEYDKQHYEGGSTLFGRLTQPAYAQEMTRLASALAAGRSVASGTLPPDSPLGSINLQTGVVHDNPPAGTKFGDCLDQPRASYARGDVVRSTFVTGHPKNDLRLGGTYLEVQRRTATGWTRVHDDGDWSTKLHWIRTRPVLGESNARVEWTIPDDTPAGTYRIVHHGAAKAPVTGVISRFTGRSNTFIIG